METIVSKGCNRVTASEADLQFKFTNMLKNADQGPSCQSYSLQGSSWDSSPSSAYILMKNGKENARKEYKSFSPRYSNSLYI